MALRAGAAETKTQFGLAVDGPGKKPANALVASRSQKRSEYWLLRAGGPALWPCFSEAAVPCLPALLPPKCASFAKSVASMATRRVSHDSCSAAACAAIVCKHEEAG